MTSAASITQWSYQLLHGVNPSFHTWGSMTILAVANHAHVGVKLGERHERLGYRADIDGLRAVSVLSVLFYHLKVSVFGGGFVGVDIFFVISGYLITRNILQDLAEKRFSLLSFLERRIRRLFPAFFATIILIAVAGALWLPGEHLKNLARDMTPASISLANVHFWQRARDYFAPDVDKIPLLHFWSLSLEEQYYLVWPLVLMACHRLMSRSGLALIIAATSVVSLAACQFYLQSGSIAPFFLTPFRIYEFGIGALLVLAECKWRQFERPNGLLALTGLAMIGWSVVTFDQTITFPGLYALVPCVGAAAVILAGPAHRSATLLTNRAAVWIGLISYSLYLVHWPLIVFGRYVFGGLADSTTGKLCLVVISIVVAYLMYRFVETPFRRPRPGLQRLKVFASAAALTALVVGLSYAVRADNGWSWRLSADKIVTAEQHLFGFHPCSHSSQSSCRFGDLEGKPGLQLLGDSHAKQYVAAFDPLLARLGLRGESYSAGGCPMLRGVINPDEKFSHCRHTRDLYLSRLRENNAPIVINHYWLGYRPYLLAEDTGEKATGEADQVALWRSALDATLRELAKDGRRFLIIGAGVEFVCAGDQYRFSPGPLWHAPSQPCPPQPSEEAKKRTAAFNSMLREFQSSHPSTTVLLPEEYLCTSECPAMDGDNWLYWDAHHLTVAGAQYISVRAEHALLRFIGK
jgi:peptidoglycan/LPS O-acetylase OafA/YrhL